MFEECLTKYPNVDNRVTFKNFIDVCKNFKREYNKYRTFLPKFNQ